MPRPGASPARGVCWVALVVLSGLALTVGAWLVMWLGGVVCEAIEGWGEGWE